jgi:hypothetical protein
MFFMMLVLAWLKLNFDPFWNDPVVQRPFLHIVIGASRYCMPGGGYVFPRAGCRIAGAQQSGRAREQKKADEDCR